MALSAKSVLENKIFPVFGIFFFLAFQSLSYFSLWTETEIYPAHTSQYLWTENMSNFLFSLKPFFYLALRLSSVFSDWLSLPPMTGARALFALNGLALMALMYFYIKQTAGKYSAILAVLLLAGSNIFLDRGFRIRSDLLASSLCLASLLISLKAKREKSLWGLYIAIPLLLSTLLVSLKGVYWLLFGSCLMAHNLRRSFPSLRPFVKIALASGAALCALSWIFNDPFFARAVQESLKFWLFSARETLRFISENGLIKSLSQISHIRLFAERNLLIILIICAKLSFTAYSTAISKKRKWNLTDLHFAILLAVFLFHPQQKLFFLCALAPFFCIAFFTDQIWRRWTRQIYSPQFKTLLLAGALLFAGPYVSYFNYRILTKKNNRQQKEMIQNLNRFYERADPAISIFDPGCLIYSRQTDCKYILDAHWIERLEPYIKERGFDLILGARHLNLFDLTYYKDPPFQYVNVQNHIFYKAFIMDLPLAKGAKRNSPKAGFLSGKAALRPLRPALKSETAEESRKYFYLFLDSHSQPIKKAKNCLRPAGSALQPGCPYSQKEFQAGWIPKTNKKLALFYLPFPPGLSEDLSLRALFRYDMY